jgi:hypothetical protein
MPNYGGCVEVTGTANGIFLKRKPFLKKISCATKLIVDKKLLSSIMI